MKKYTLKEEKVVTSTYVLEAENEEDLFEQFRSNKLILEPDKRIEGLAILDIINVEDIQADIMDDDVEDEHEVSEGEKVEPSENRNE